MLVLQKYQNFAEKNEVFNHIVINDFQELIAVIEDYNKFDNFIFRGVNNASYKIYSSLHRYFIDRGVSVYNGKLPQVLSNIIAEICKKEYLIYPVIQYILPYFDNEYFIRENKRIYSKMLIDHFISFYLLSILQHYGGISSLIDFTNNINYAIFFSTSNWKSKKMCDYEPENYISLYILNPEIYQVAKFDINKYNDIDRNMNKENIIEYLNAISMSNKEDISKQIIDYILFQFVSGIEYYPLDDFIINKNILAQQGCFVSYKHYGNKPLEDYCENKSITCIDISKKLIPLIQQKILEPNKISRDKLFPDLKKQVEQIMLDAEKLFLDFSE